MTGLEIENFYALDTKEYNIDQNQEFIALFEKFRNYNRDFNKGKIKCFMEDIVRFYEFKYPNEMFDGTPEYTEEYKQMLEITKLMDVKQLEFRIHHDARTVLVNDYEDYFKIEINRDTDIYPFFTLIHIEQGILNVYDLDSIKKYILLKKKKITPEEFYAILEQSNIEMDYSALKRLLDEKHFTNLIRKKILELTALKMLYSENTLPIYAYPRIKCFIKEFNEAYGLTLDCQKIDEIMALNYKNKDINAIKRELFIKK